MRRRFALIAPAEAGIAVSAMAVAGQLRAIVQERRAGRSGFARGRMRILVWIASIPLAVFVSALVRHGLFSGCCMDNIAASAKFLADQEGCDRTCSSISLLTRSGTWSAAK
jgi:hypothetical protein